MGDLVTTVGMLGVLIWAWREMARRWQAKGWRWWILHPAALLLAVSAAFGLLFVCMGLGIATSTDGDESGPIESIFSGLIMSAPLLMALWVTRANQLKRAPAASKSTNKKTSTGQQKKRAEKLRRSNILARVPGADQQSSQPAAPGNLKFVYEDGRGTMSTREVSSWVESGDYIEGFCLTANDVRTFRKDRVISMISGEKLLTDMSEGRSKPPSKKRHQKIEILFTGFAANDREYWEITAQEAGMLVRKSVTENLTYLCAGTNAGPITIAEAESVGAVIINEFELNELLEHGVLPGN